MIQAMTCPICEKTLPAAVTGESSVFPFCSPRCKQVDLYRWLNGDYALIEDVSFEEILGISEDDADTRTDAGGGSHHS